MEEYKHMEDSEQGLFSRDFLDTWHGNYRRLKATHRQRSPTVGDMDEEMARWVNIQRRIRHMLPAELKVKLAALVIDFDDKGGSWESMRGQLAVFVERNGHAFLPDDPKHEALRDWLNRQILSKRLLSKSQLQSLESLGVDWGAAAGRDQRWELMLGRLRDFHTAFGHCRVPQRWAKDKQLALWVTVQRRMHAKGGLCEDRRRKLQEIGFTWDIKSEYEAHWEEYFQELVSFRKAHGHCRVPGKHHKLVSWMERQRLSRKKGLLAEERERRLDGIGFTWSFEGIKKKGWEERYRQLRMYWQKHGHSFVPVNCKENKSLGTWVATQRLMEAKGKLGARKKKKLSELGFVWSRDTRKQLQSVYDFQWETNFDKLKAYREAHGTCQVSLKIDPVLQRWTRWQRILFYQGKLLPERTDRLNEIRFPWCVQEGYWMRMYDALVEFKKEFGHTCVPSQWGPSPRLAAWVYRTRRDKQELTLQKVELLNKIDFDWTLSRKTVVSWEVMYGRLVAFRQAHGHTRVPLGWKKDRKLGKWVSRMRYQRERLASERAALLEAIGFDWSPQPAPENHKVLTCKLALA